MQLPFGITRNTGNEGTRVITRAIATDVMFKKKKNQARRKRQKSLATVWQHGGLVKTRQCMYLISGAQSCPWQAPWSHFGFDQSRLHACSMKGLCAADVITLDNFRSGVFFFYSAQYGEQTSLQSNENIIQSPGAQAR